MIVALTIITGLLAAALVLVVVVVLAAASRQEKLRVEERAMLLRAVIARGATEVLPPGSELRALRELEKAAARAPGPLVGAGTAEMDEMEEARKIRHGRAFADGLIDEHGADIMPTGF